MNSTKHQTIPYDETLFKILGRIGHKMGATVSLDAGLWSVDEIAGHLKRGRRDVIKNVVTLPSFPKAIQLPAGTSGKRKGRPLWKARDVEAWADAGGVMTPLIGGDKVRLIKPVDGCRIGFVGVVVDSAISIGDPENQPMYFIEISDGSCGWYTADELEKVEGSSHGAN